MARKPGVSQLGFEHGLGRIAQDGETVTRLSESFQGRLHIRIRRHRRQRPPGRLSGKFNPVACGHHLQHRGANLVEVPVTVAHRGHQAVVQQGSEPQGHKLVPAAERSADGSFERHQIQQCFIDVEQQDLRPLQRHGLVVSLLFLPVIFGEQPVNGGVEKVIGVVA